MDCSRETSMKTDKGMPLCLSCIMNIESDVKRDKIYFDREAVDEAKQHADYLGWWMWWQEFPPDPVKRTRSLYRGFRRA